MLLLVKGCFAFLNETLESNFIHHFQFPDPLPMFGMRSCGSLFPTVQGQSASGQRLPRPDLTENRLTGNAAQGAAGTLGGPEKAVRGGVKWRAVGL